MELDFRKSVIQPIVESLCSFVNRPDVQNGLLSKRATWFVQEKMMKMKVNRYLQHFASN